MAAEFYIWEYTQVVFLPVQAYRFFESIVPSLCPGASPMEDAFRDGDEIFPKNE
jgi:hypothetical protein